MSTRRPTKQNLINAVLMLLTDHQPQDITIEMVLQRSGVSSGSLYHHFNDFGDLMDQALAAQYADFVMVGTAGMRNALDAASTAEEYEHNLHRLIEKSYALNTSRVRVLRANIAAQAATRPTLRKLVASEQSRLTQGLADIIREAQSLHWVRSDLDATALATFIQAYNLGRILDDISDPGLDNDAWIALVRHVVSTSMLIR